MCVKGVVNKTHLEDKIGFKGLQWVILKASVVKDPLRTLVNWVFVNKGG